MELETVASDIDWVRRLPPEITYSTKKLGEPVIAIHDLTKCLSFIIFYFLISYYFYISTLIDNFLNLYLIAYMITGREEAVTALHGVQLSPDSEFYPIRRYYFYYLTNIFRHFKNQIM